MTIHIWRWRKTLLMTLKLATYQILINEDNMSFYFHYYCKINRRTFSSKCSNYHQLQKYAVVIHQFSFLCRVWFVRQCKWVKFGRDWQPLKWILYRCKSGFRCIESKDFEGFRPREDLPSWSCPPHLKYPRKNISFLNMSFFWKIDQTCVTCMCRNDELSSTMS